jgi:ribosomally synthesized peptide (two-chain TOMM family)
MSMNKLLEFRTTFLRAIAEAWADPIFREHLTDAKNQDAAIKALRAKFGYQWPWENVCELAIREAQGHFDWIDGEWVWSSHDKEGLTMCLPLDPSSPHLQIPCQYHALALADYYRQRASVFDDDWGAHDPPRDPNAPRTDSEDQRTAARLAEDTSSADADGGGSSPEQAQESWFSPPPAGGFMPDNTEFGAFKVALLGALARAWHDKQFRKKLEINAITALSSIRGYQLPWNLRIHITDDPQARWNPPRSLSHLAGTQQVSHWVFGQKHRLTLYLPTRPSEVQSEPLALAMYNATGAEYPFTCTC